MKKTIKCLGLVLILMLLVGTFGETTTFAYDKDTQIRFSYDYQVKTLKKNQVQYFEVYVSNPNLTLSAQSADTSVVSLSEPRPDKERPGYFAFTLVAVGEGRVTLTFTASDGTTTGDIAEVSGVMLKDYHLTSDTTQDFSIVQDNSYFLTLTYRKGSSGTDNPLLAADSDAFHITLISIDYVTDEYLYRLDAVGSVGESATLYTGSLNYLPDSLCKVTIGKANKDLRVDTGVEYQFSPGDTYRFVVYTSSLNIPKASTNNSLTSVQYMRQVSGGYEYQVKALSTGYSLVRVSQNGETASFPIFVTRNLERPYVHSDSEAPINLGKGESYIYKITVMGGGEPYFFAGTPGVVSTELLKKVGPDYYCRVTGTSNSIGNTTSLYIRFPERGENDEPARDVGYIRTVAPKPVAMSSDTTQNFTLEQGKSYTFRLTGATSFSAGTSGIFTTKLVKKSGNDSYYQITANGKPGQAAGFYMSSGGSSKLICAVTVGAVSHASVPMQSDTNRDFYLRSGSSYVFKITGAQSFTAGTSGVFKTELIKKSGNDAYYRITAIGKSGQSTGFYMSASGQETRKVCVVTAVDAGFFVSDTTKDFNLLNKHYYTFKITAPGAKKLEFYPGTAGIFWPITITRVGDDFYCKLYSISSGPSSGIYVRVDGGLPQKLCTINLIPGGW